MARRSAPLWLLALLALSLPGSCVGASSHSLKYFYTAISEPSQGQPYFVSVGFVDDQLISYYDSHSQKTKPGVSWMEKVRKDDPQYWDSQTQIKRKGEEVSREDLEILRNRYNQSEGFHTWQVMYGCELRGDGSKGGFNQYGYDGRTFITFDKEALTWVASDPQAQITQRKWDGMPGYNRRHKDYLEEICIEWLEKYLSYGNETLLRTDTPMVTVNSRMVAEDGMETHVCRLDGFYPRKIDASWTRDGEVWLQDTFHGSVAPNADGTYHHWLSIRIDPKERDRYRCHVGHDGLQHPLDVALKEPTNSKSNLGLIIIGCVVVALVQVVCLIAGIWFFKKCQDGFKATPKPTNSKSNLGIIIIIIGWGLAGLGLVGLTAVALMLFKPTNSKSNLGLIIISYVVAALGLVGLTAGALIFFKKRQDGYKATSKKHQDGYRAALKPTNSKSNLGIIIIGSGLAGLGLVGLTAVALMLFKPTNSKSNLGLIIIGCVVVAALVLVIAGIVVFFKKRQDGYKATPTQAVWSKLSSKGHRIQQFKPGMNGHSQHEERGGKVGSTFF